MGIRILDGGMGRELLRIGAPFQQPEWSALALIQAPEFVRTAHDSFVRAGADLITTNSYAVVPFHIGEERFSKDGLRLAALAGKLAREAADAGSQPVQVAGSLPPVFGSYRPDLFDAAKAAPLLDTLVEGLTPYVDIWLGETLSSTAEAKAIHAALNGDSRLCGCRSLSTTRRISTPLSVAMQHLPCAREKPSRRRLTWRLRLACRLFSSTAARPRSWKPRYAARVQFGRPRRVTSRWVCMRTRSCRNGSAAPPIPV